MGFSFEKKFSGCVICNWDEIGFSFFFLKLLLSDEFEVGFSFLENVFGYLFQILLCFCIEMVIKFEELVIIYLLCGRE